ncbi:MAG: hypothetical protein NTZ67_03055 [Gammaproteobacteria bacterium]|nr:hypothetical protein [Gammaproteobacteria bacterium]
MPSQKIKTDIIFNFSESEMGLLNSGTEANKTISLYALAEKINNLFDSKDKAELGARLQKVILKYSATKTEDNDTIQTEGKGTYGKYGTF